MLLIHAPIVLGWSLGVDIFAYLVGTHGPEFARRQVKSDASFVEFAPRVGAYFFFAFLLVLSALSIGGKNKFIARLAANTSSDESAGSDMIEA